MCTARPSHTLIVLYFSYNIIQFSPVYKHISYVSSEPAMHLSRTAHSGEWDARISIQNHEAAHQYHCPGHHFLTAEIKEC
jgi:hypothetical protein